MARLFTEGFEFVAGADLVNSMTKTTWDSVTGTPAIITTTSLNHGGLQVLKAPAGATAAWAAKGLNAAISSGSLYYRFYLYFESAASTPTGTVAILRSVSSTSNGNFAVRIDAVNSKFVLENTIASTTVSSTYTFTTGKWYRVEVQQALATGATGSLTLKIYDGDTSTVLDTLTFSSIQTINTDAHGIEFGNRTGTDMGSVMFDDFGWNDSTGTSQNSWLGAGKVVGVYPISDIAVSWTKSTGTVNYGNVNDVPGATPDDGTTYNSDTDVSSYDKFKKTQLSISDMTDGNITLLHLYARAGGAGSTKLSLWDSATQVLGGQLFNPGAGSWKKTSEADDLVYDLSGRTVSGVNSIYIGYQAYAGSGSTKQISAVFGVIEYVPNLSHTITATAGTPYATQAKPARAITLPYYSVMSVNQAKLTNYESKATSSSVAHVVTICYEFLKKVSQKF